MVSPFDTEIEDCDRFVVGLIWSQITTDFDIVFSLHHVRTLLKLDV